MTAAKGLLLGIAFCGGLFFLLIIAVAIFGEPEDKSQEASTEGTEATTTEAPTTEAPTTEAPTTEAPTTEAPTTAPPATVPPTTPPDPFAGETVSQRNARQTAADYLDYSSFSRSGLIEQLEFEGFTAGDATYGVDALNVDWNEQAAKTAADYLDYSSFSHSGLVDQLVFEGFTQAQAEYGVSTTGL
jgi:type IV secretory pathway VirB10-like protein